MKKPLTLIFILSFLLVSLNAQTIYWAKNAAGSALDEGNGIAIDNNGNTYITGQFESTSLNFGNGVTITNTWGNTAAFVAKFNNSGNCVWAKSFGGNADDYGAAITVDGNGNVYAAGYFNSSPLNIGTTTLTNSGDKDLFIVKYNTAGDFQWARSATGTYDDEATGISSDNSGNIYITGIFWSNSLSFGTNTVNNNGSPDLFLAKYSGNGDAIWALAMGGNGSDRGTGIITDAAGNSFITGSFDSPSVNFGGTLLSNPGSDYCMFLAKYTTGGTIDFARSVSATAGGVEPLGISLDGSGNIFVAGTFDGSAADFGTGPLTNVRPGGSNAFIAKYSSAGTIAWARNPVSGPEGNQAYCVAADASGNSYISGWYTSPSVTFGTFPLSSSAFGDNIYVAKYNPSGTVVAANSYCGSGMSGGYGNAIVAGTGGAVYLTGYFEGTNMQFGSTNLLNTNSSTWDVYWTKLSQGANGIDENTLNQNLFFYPNPSAGVLKISNKAGYVLQITDVNGKIIYEKPISGFNETIDLTNQPSGIYFLRAISPNKVQTEKLIISH